MKKTNNNTNSSSKEEKSILCFDDRISESEVHRSSSTFDRRLQQDLWHHSSTKRRRSNVKSTDPPSAPAQTRVSDAKHVVRKIITEYSDDGYTWRKYGQKDILGAKYSRAYYRCAYMYDQGCNAKKQVQRVNEGNAYELFYRGSHTCSVVTGIMPGSTSEDSDSQPFRISFGMGESRELEVPTSSTANMSFAVTEIPFLGPKGTYTPDSKRETCFQGSSQIRQEEPIISSSITAESMLSANDRSKKAGENEITLTHRPLRNLEDLDSNSWSTLKYGGSTDSNLQRLFSAFQDVDVKKIGVYGNEGIGKTTLMKAFRSRYDLKRLFSLILWVTIPKCSSRRKVQNALVQQLSINVPDTCSDDEVAMILRQNFLARKFVLFLDGVCEHMDLQKVGIPVGNSDKDYKIILTSRSIQICKAMEVDRIIEARVLSREESLRLFRFHVGHVLDSQDIEPYGRAIVSECSGLPLVIKVAGRALRSDNCAHRWKHALKEILLTNNLQILKIGYDRLKEHDLRSCFLYSALFIEHKAVRISSLVECLVDEGFVAGSMSDAHGRGHDIINQLVDVSLLECIDNGSKVEMHGLILDLAFVILSDVNGLQMLLSRYLKSILPKKTLLLDISNPQFQPEDSERGNFSPSEGHLSILKAGDGLREPPLEEEWEKAKMVFLMDNELSSLPKRPACSKLQILFLQRNSSLRNIPSSFFENMTSLQILNLSKTRIKSLPLSLSKLHFLQVLILRNCERLLHLPPAIGALKHLLVLDVHGTEICQLPDQIGELFCLVHLQLCFYGTMDQDECAMLPPKLMSKGVISNFSQLRELSIIVYPGDPRWTKIASDVTIEVSNLKLCSLSFHFPDIKHLEYFINVSPAWLHRTLTRFNFIVGHDVKRVTTHVSADLEHEYNQQDQCLRFVDGKDVPDAIEKVLHQTTAFYLDHHLTAHSLSQFTWAAINRLKFCIVKDCPKLKTIVNNTKATASCFPSLELLSIHYSWNLSHIWMGPIKAGSLSMLRRLSLHSCPKLEVILSLPLVAVLSNLEELIVVDCQSVKNVISSLDRVSADEDVGDSDFTEPNVSELNSEQEKAKDKMEVDPPKVAELRIKVLKLHYLPKLVNIWSVGDLPCLEYVSVYNCPRLRNLNLKSHAEVTIKEIKTEIDWWENLEWENPALPAKLQSRVKKIQCEDMWGNV